MSAINNNYRQLDVAFLLLNDLTTKLRTAGARISVRKVGNLHRITVLKEPTVASIEQILSYTSGETETSNLSSSNAITSPTESTSLPDETPSESSSDTVPAVSEEIGENSVADAIARSAVPKAIAQSTQPNAIALPASPKSTSPLDDNHSVDSNDMIPRNTAELIIVSSDSSTPVNSSSEITNIPNSPELANLEDLLPLTPKRLKELAKFHKIPGFSRMKEEKLVAKLHGLATKEQIL